MVSISTVCSAARNKYTFHNQFTKPYVPQNQLFLHGKEGFDNHSHPNYTMVEVLGRGILNLTVLLSQQPYFEFGQSV
jgi:hypothetical protein